MIQNSALGAHVQFIPEDGEGGPRISCEQGELSTEKYLSKLTPIQKCLICTEMIGDRNTLHTCRIAENKVYTSDTMFLCRKTNVEKPYGRRNFLIFQRYQDNSAVKDTMKTAMKHKCMILKSFRKCYEAWRTYFHSG